MLRVYIESCPYHNYCAAAAPPAPPPVPPPEKKVLMSPLSRAPRFRFVPRSEVEDALAAAAAAADSDSDSDSVLSLSDSGDSKLGFAASSNASLLKARRQVRDRVNNFDISDTKVFALGTILAKSLTSSFASSVSQ